MNVPTGPWYCSGLCCTDSVGQTKWSVNINHWNVLRFCRNSVAGFNQVRFGENGCTVEEILEVMDVGNVEIVSDDDLVETTVIIARSPIVLKHFEHHTKWGYKWAV